MTFAAVSCLHLVLKLAVLLCPNLKVCHSSQAQLSSLKELHDL